MIVPQLEQWMAGEEPDEDTFNTRCRDVLEFLLEPPQAMAVAVSTQPVYNVTWTAMNIDSTVKDNDGIHDPTNHRFVIQTPGWYEVVYGASLDAATYAGRRIVALRVNGAKDPSGYRSRLETTLAKAGTPNWASGGGLHCLFLNAGDTLETVCYQDSGTTIYTTASSVMSYPFLQVRWVSI